MCFPLSLAERKVALIGAGVPIIAYFRGATKKENTMDGMYQMVRDTLSAFMILFAVIDITGSIPLIAAMIDRGQTYKSGVAAFTGLTFFITFLFLGQAILSFLGVDFQSFAVAGAIVLLALAAEMIFDIHIFRDNAPSANVTYVPLVFPLIAGPGALTTMISLRSLYTDYVIITAIVLNILVVYVVLRHVRLVQKLLGSAGIYAMRKFFGVILTAVGIKLLLSNLADIIQQINWSGH